MTNADKLIKEIAELTYLEIIDLPIIYLHALRGKARRIRKKRRK